MKRTDVVCPHCATPFVIEEIDIRPPFDPMARMKRPQTEAERQRVAAMVSPHRSGDYVCDVGIDWNGGWVYDPL